LVYIWYIPTFYFAAIAWSPHRHGLLATGGGGEADQCINFWNSFTGQSLCRVDTGSQVTNVAWLEDSPELVSFLHIKVVLSFVLEMVFFDNSKDSLLYSEQVMKYLKVMQSVFNL
jgi:WD40 repeat protein